METLWKTLTVAVPLVSALLVWLMGKQRRSRRQLVATTLACGATALDAGAVLSFIGWESVSATVGVAVVFALSLGNAARFWMGYRWDGKAQKGSYYALWLLATAALAGLALAPTLLTLAGFWFQLIVSGYQLAIHDDLDEDIRACAREHWERHRYN